MLDDAMPQRDIHHAVIYCRVSDKKQVSHGDGLNSQETRCREYARHRGYEVAEVFHDSMTGSRADRPAMLAMMDYLRRNKARGTVVVIDDISRLARNVTAHSEIRIDLARVGGRLECPSFTFADDPDSRLVEYLMASVAQHHREKNREQTINRMRARTMNGYWCFQAPTGYTYRRVHGHGKMLVPDEPIASILREALEGFASGRFETQVEVKRFLEAQPDYPKDGPDGTVRNQRITQLLTRPLYAGYIHAPRWNIPLRRGHHEALISLETFDRIQDRLKGNAKAPARKDIREDFPLRGFVLCADCNNPMTSCWSKSKTGVKHPYYMCHTPDCPSCRKSIRRDVLEGSFADMLKSMQPAEGMARLVRTMFEKAWAQRADQEGERRKAYKRDVADIEKKIEGLLDRVVDAQTPSVVTAYEARVAKLEKDRAILLERLEKVQGGWDRFEEFFELAFAFLSSPWKIWQNGDLAMRRTVLRLAFAERLAYSRESGLRTPETAIPFRYLEAISGGESRMARP